MFVSGARRTYGVFKAIKGHLQYRLEFNLGQDVSSNILGFRNKFQYLDPPKVFIYINNINAVEQLLSLCSCMTEMGKTHTGSDLSRILWLYSEWYFIMFISDRILAKE